MASGPEDSTALGLNTVSSGSSTSPNSRASSAALEEATRRTTKLWLIDFHHVRPITMDDKGLDRAVKAMWYNGLYFPMPLQRQEIQKKAWNAFVTSYVAASEMILRENDSEELFNLPRELICRLIEIEKVRWIHRY